MKAVLIEERHKHIANRFCLTLPQFQQTYQEHKLSPPDDQWQAAIIAQPSTPAIRLNYCLAYVGDENWTVFFGDISLQPVPVVINQERIFSLPVTTAPKYHPQYKASCIPYLPVSQKEESTKQNLLITMGCRAGCMDCTNQISLPAGILGEASLSEFVTAMVNAYMTAELETEFGFDDYIENLLLVRFPPEDAEKYHGK